MNQSMSGSNLDLKIDNTVIIGNFNHVQGDFNHVVGRDNQVEGNNNTVMGCNNTIKGKQNRYIGVGTHVEGDLNECMNCSPPNDLVEIIKSCSKCQKPMVMQSKTSENSMIHISGDSIGSGNCFGSTGSTGHHPGYSNCNINISHENTMYHI